MNVLVTGATGYIGARLAPRLVGAGHRVRVGVRDPMRIAGRPWSKRVEAVRSDVTDPTTLPAALDGIDAAYYLIHSMADTHDFRARDAAAATAFGEAAKAAGVSHVIYLGGLLPETTELSEHLLSRKEVGETLAGLVPTTEFRAGPIIGSGSASFEMARYLTERLPAMVAPKWIMTPVSPIGVADVMRYLVAALEKGPQGVVPIGAEPLPFRGMMAGYARVRGLPRRLIVPVPVLTPHLAGLWVQLVTPIPNKLAVPIIKGIVHPLVADTARARELFPDIEPISYEEAVKVALGKIKESVVESRWSDALADAPAHHLELKEGIIREIDTRLTSASPSNVYHAAAGLGGERGWPWDVVWRVRGGLDRAVGGPGLRRGRRNADNVRVGDALDFWRVEVADPPRRLLLRAEMKVPGRAWLEWRINAEDDGTRLTQTAFFAPLGLWGVTYWHALYPVHKLIFRRMARHIVESAEKAQEGARGPTSLRSPSRSPSSAPTRGRAPKKHPSATSTSGVRHR